jgi:hypothetical protein
MLTEGAQSPKVRQSIRTTGPDKGKKKKGTCEKCWNDLIIS